MDTVRRDALKRWAACVGAGLVGPWAMASAAAAPRPALRVLIPANPGGGWDQTGRSLGAAFEAGGLVQKVAYANKGGKGGTLGLSEFVQQHTGDPSALLVGGLVMVGALAASGSLAMLRQVVPLARLTSDYLVLAAAAGSPWRDLRTVTQHMKSRLPEEVFTGGSAGGVDHMLAGMVARAVRADVAQLQYRPTSSGRDAIAQLRSGAAQVVISGYSEFKAAFEDRSLAPLAVSSGRTLYGLPSLREQGVDTEQANWRSVFAPAGLSPAQLSDLGQLVQQAAQTPTWRQALQASNWQASPLFDKDLLDFIEIEQGIASVVTMMLKLKG